MVVLANRFGSSPLQEDPDSAWACFAEKTNLNLQYGLIKGPLTGLPNIEYQGIAPFLIFKASAIWADAFFNSKCPSVRVFVCLSVHF